MNGACGASPKPLPRRLVSGVPAEVSRGGGGGLPDLPREARGWGVVSALREDVAAERTREDGTSSRVGGVVPEARTRDEGPDFGGRGMGGNMAAWVGRGNG